MIGLIHIHGRRRYSSLRRPPSQHTAMQTERMAMATGGGFGSGASSTARATTAPASPTASVLHPSSHHHQQQQQQQQEMEAGASGERPATVSGGGVGRSTIRYDQDRALWA